MVFYGPRDGEFQYVGEVGLVETYWDQGEYHTSIFLKIPRNDIPEHLQNTSPPTYYSYTKMYESMEKHHVIVCPD